jgi:phage/plasmid-associated DNA primase
LQKSKLTTHAPLQLVREDPPDGENGHPHPFSLSYARGRFEIPTAVRRANDEWLKEANPLTSFVDECCSREDPLGKCLLQDFYDRYRHWAQQRGYTKTQQYQTVKRNLENLGFPTKKGNRGIAIMGLTLGGIRG